MSLPIDALSCESETCFHRPLEAIEEAYYKVDLRGNLLCGNAALYRMLGCTEAELLGHSHRRVQTFKASAAAYRQFNRVYHTGRPATGCDWELRHKNGSLLLVEGSIHLIRTPDGKPAGFHGFLRDVTERRRTERALRESEAKYRGILETLQDPYYEVDLGGVLVLCNSAFCRLLGRPAAEIIGRSYRDFQTPEVALQVSAVFNTVYRTGEPAQCFDWAMIRKDGTSITGEGSVQLVRDLNGMPCGFHGILRDVTERRRVEQALRESEARFRALTRLSSDWYWEQDEQFRYTRMESRRSGTEGARAVFIGKCPWESGLEIETGWTAHRALLAAHRPFRDVVMHRRLGGGRLYYISVSGEPFFRADGSFAGYRGVSREITDQKLAEDRIQHLATHDVLTGLPNRAMFSQMLSISIRQARRNHTQCAVLFIDLDRFKTINDTLGHDAGDCLLKEVTDRFRASLGSGDVIARLGGDEFVVLVRDMSDATQAVGVARMILAAAIRPVMLSGRECRVTASIGVAMYPQDGQDERTLMKNADIAMYAAKAEGKNNVRFYSREIGPQSLERLTLESLLQHALERDEFSLHYQPKLHLKHNRICGVEALLRWNSRELGEVPPSQFIPLAEETGMIIDIGKWALRTACAQNVAWQDAGLPPLSMAVNLSVRQFSDENLLQDIAAILAQTGMAPQLLELEITEGIVIHQPTRAARLLEDIKCMGIRLAIDDFGTGYSSLGQLKKFPIDTLKIDRSFIRDIATNPEDRALTEAIIAMGRALGLTVVAEGVETPEQEAFLRARGCDELQGFHFARPLPADGLAALLPASSTPAA